MSKSQIEACSFFLSPEYALCHIYPVSHALVQDVVLELRCVPLAHIVVIFIWPQQEINNFVGKRFYKTASPLLLIYSAPRKRATNSFFFFQVDTPRGTAVEQLYVSEETPFKKWIVISTCCYFMKERERFQQPSYGYFPVDYRATFSSLGSYVSLELFLRLLLSVEGLGWLFGLSAIGSLNYFGGFRCEFQSKKIQNYHFYSPNVHTKMNLRPRRIIRSLGLGYGIAALHSTAVNGVARGVCEGVTNYSRAAWSPFLSKIKLESS